MYGGGENKDFVFTATTTTAAEVMTIPCQNVGVFNATIDWGDGSAASTITAYNDADLSHTYATAGTYTITVSGAFPNVYFYGDAIMAAKVATVENLGSVGWETLFRSFYNCTGMTSVAAGDSDTSAVTDFGYAFIGCSAATSFDMTGMDVSSGTSFNRTFSGCSAATDINMAGWVCSSGTDFTSMFYNCTSLVTADVSTFDMTSATTLSYMFNGCTALADAAIDGWNIEAVTAFTNFYRYATLPTSRYDATLIAWDAQNPVDSLAVNFGGSKYTLGGAAETARSNLIATDLWTITDGGGV